VRKPDREAFDELMDMCRTYVSECACVNSLTEFEPMVMSILLSQQKRIAQLERELKALRPEDVEPSEAQVQTGSVEP